MASQRKFPPSQLAPDRGLLIGPPPPAKPAENVLAEGHASAIVVRAHAMDSAIGWCHATP